MKHVNLSITLLDGREIVFHNIVLDEHGTVNDIVTSVLTLFPTTTSMVIALT